MFENPPPDGNLVVEISASISMLAPGGRSVEQGLEPSFER
jgi:hypothetical protein